MFTAMHSSILLFAIWNFNTGFVTPVRNLVLPSFFLFFFQVSFSRVSIYLELHFRSYLQKKKSELGKTRLGWCMNNAMPNFHVHLRKIGPRLANLLFWHGLGCFGYFFSPRLRNLGLLDLLVYSFVVYSEVLQRQLISQPTLFQFVVEYMFWFVPRTASTLYADLLQLSNCMCLYTTFGLF